MRLFDFFKPGTLNLEPAAQSNSVLKIRLMLVGSLRPILLHTFA